MPSTGPLREAADERAPGRPPRSRCPAGSARRPSRRASSAAQRNVDTARVDLGARPLDRLAVLGRDQARRPPRCARRAGATTCMSASARVPDRQRAAVGRDRVGGRDRLLDLGRRRHRRRWRPASRRTGAGRRARRGRRPAARRGRTGSTSVMATRVRRSRARPRLSTTYVRRQRRPAVPSSEPVGRLSRRERLARAAGRASQSSARRSASSRLRPSSSSTRRMR